MFNLVFVKENGLISSYAKVEQQELYQEGTDYNGQFIKYVPDALKDIDAGTLAQTYYVKEGVFNLLPAKDTEYLVWDLASESWLEPVGYLDTLKTTNTVEVNRLAGDKILSIYPFYLQHNIGRDIVSAEAVTMFAYIDSIRALADAAKISIAASTTLKDIRTIMNAYSADIKLI
jgi:hypothetical protein